jgi:hypothetical protein
MVRQSLLKSIDKNQGESTMKKLLLYISLFFLLSCCSCRSTLMLMYGIRNPEVESKKSIYSFLQKIKQDTDNVYCMDTVLYQQFRSESFKPGMAPGFRPAQIKVYDKSGSPVMQWASCEGYLKDLEPFDSVPPRNINGLDTSINLEQDLSRYFTLDGIPARITVQEGYDYYILVYFAKFFPGISKESFEEVGTYIRKHPELRIMVYKINTDLQAFWDVELRFDAEIATGSKH